MYRTFNMGVGMVVIADEHDVSPVIEAAAAQGVPAWRLGRVGAGKGAVQLT
jgi:phosphoribosylformylglycinamidine cyclo-ligase